MIQTTWLGIPHALRNVLPSKRVLASAERDTRRVLCRQAPEPSASDSFGKAGQDGAEMLDLRALTEPAAVGVIGSPLPKRPFGVVPKAYPSSVVRAACAAKARSPIDKYATVTPQDSRLQTRGVRGQERTGYTASSRGSTGA